MSDRLRFGEILVRAGAIDRDRLEAIGARLAPDADLGAELVRHGVIDEARLLQTVGQALNLPTVQLGELNPDERALKLLPQALCETHHVFPVELERSRAGEHLHLAMANPTDIRAIKQITRQARRRIRPLVASARDIGNAIAVHYGGAAPSKSHQGQGESRGADSPVDMFDFSVTDLSSIEIPGSASLEESLNALHGPSASIESVPTLRSNPAMPAIPRDAFGSSATDPASMPPSPGTHDVIDRSALDPGAVEPAGGLAMASEAARLAALRESPSRRPPSPGPPRLPPTSMPPRPSGPQPTRESGFGMIRRKKRRNERVQQISQTPSAQSEPGLLDNLDSESLRGGDRVMAKYLERYQRTPDRPGGDAFLAALDRALRKSGSPTAQLLLVLVRQLVQQGIIDADALIEDLLRS